MTRVLGIDPGATGALALIEAGKVVACYDMPCDKTATGKRRIVPVTLAGIVRALLPLDHVTIELVGPMPRDGHAGSFWFGKAAGLVEGVVAALGLPVSFVAPAVWKRRFGLIGAGKAASRAKASHVFGRTASADLWPLVKHDGRAEAALIGLYGEMTEAAKLGGGVVW
jgi:crossover junction endodeoxyribonuclease RuvC